MKIMVYSFREDDEKAFFDEFCAKEGFEYVACAGYP